MGAAAFKLALEAAETEYCTLGLLLTKLHTERTALRRELDEANAAKHALLRQLQQMQSKSTDDKFDRLKKILAKKLHPNALIGRPSLEIQVGERMFKMIWPEIERIERG